MRAIIWMSLALTLLCGCVAHWRSSLPELEGEVRVQGLEEPVEIVRDRWGVPHIRAASEADAVFALGWVHAQDRLWQLELNRRIGAGTLSEVFGKRALAADRYLRTVGFRARSAEALEHIGAEWGWIFEAYCAGINAYLATDPDLPPEFGLVGIQEVRPFEPVDGFTWIKLMSQSLAADASTEEFRTMLAARVDAALVDDLLAPYPGGAVIQPPDGRTDGGTAAAAAGQRGPGWASSAAFGGGAPPFLRQLLTVGEPGLGSNNWVVDGAHTTTGAPLLANDPHLGFQMPSLWYLAHIQGGEMDVIGCTFPGLPLVVIGHNRHLAWGLTNVGPDVQDLVLEKIHDVDPNLVMFDGRYVEMTVREEVIAVKGGRDVVLTVRETPHGPLVTEFYPGVGAEVALRWTALLPVDDTPVGFARLNAASSVEEGVEALRQFVAPAQNVVLADDQGHIGWIAAGLVPVRPEGDDGNAPVPGWDGRHEWVGWVPYEEMPHSIDPERGWIVTANNRPAPDGYAHWLGDEWSPPYRAQRIIDLLTAAMPVSAEDMARIQGDEGSVLAAELLPALRRAVDAAHPELAGYLADWDGTMEAAAVAPAIYQAWSIALPGALTDDELGDAAPEARWLNAQLLHRCFGDGACDWCDDVTTPGVTESCDDRAIVALDAGLEILRSMAGDDPDDWVWGRLHTVHFDHRFGSVKVLSRLLNRQVHRGGGPFSPNVAPYSFSHPFHTRWGASYRQVIDLADLERSRYVHTTGQSGHPASVHYDDLMPRWKGGTTIPMAFGDAAVDAVARERMVLVPAS